MNPIVVLGLHEYGNTAAGLKALDAMVKAAPIHVVDAITVNPGKFVILITGDEASVESALKASVLVSDGYLLDQLYLPNLHPGVVAALDGGSSPDEWEALGIIETTTIAAAITSADRAVKSADVSLAKIRIDDSMGGRASVRVTGAVGEVEYAVETARSELDGRGLIVHWTIIPRLSDDVHRYVQ